MNDEYDVMVCRYLSCDILKKIFYRMENLDIKYYINLIHIISIKKSTFSKIIHII